MQLYKHQQDGVDFITKNNGVGALYFEAGLGKTLTALKIFENSRKLDEKIALVVICPLTLITNAWIDDIKKFTRYTYIDLHDKKQKSEVVNKKIKADIYLLNYEMMLRKENAELICEIGGICVLDESSKIRNHSAATTKSILMVRKSFNMRVLLSGTPAPNSPEEYWSQMRFLDDNIFPGSFYSFRNRYFHLQRGKQVVNIPNGSFMTKDMARKMFSTGFKYEITETNKKALMEQMRPYVLFKKLSECIDLPPQIEVNRSFSLNLEQFKAYKNMKTELVAELAGNTVMAPFALTKLSKLRQICSGFMITNDNKCVDFQNNSKLEELLELLMEIGYNQVIIWVWFVHEADFIKKELGDNARIINGTIDEIEKTQIINDFKEKKFRYLIANPQSVAHGITLTNCHYSIYYSLSYSWEQLSQSMSRIYRIGQKESCIYYYLIADKTVDEVMLGVLKRKGTEEEIVKETLI